ncbi:MAG: hypothetical protein V3U08_06985 [Nitrospirales bacterium]
MAVLPYRLGCRIGAEQSGEHVGHQSGDLVDVYRRDVQSHALGIHAWFLQVLSAA